MSRVCRVRRVRRVRACPQTRSIVEIGRPYKIATCRCRVRNIACTACRKVVGYHVVRPCRSCLSGGTNGHYWMLESDGVVAR